MLDIHKQALDRRVSSWVKEYADKEFNSVIFRTDLVQSLIDISVAEDDARTIVNEYLFGLVKDRAAQLYINSIP